MLNDYQFLDKINDTHKVYLVKNIFDNHIYVKKTLEVYDLDVYKQLLQIDIKGIPKIKEIQKIDNKLIVIEEYIEGQTLEELIESNYTFTKEEIIKIASSLCDILSKLNKQVPIVHRDIKPSNIIKRKDEYYLIDFNAAKIIKQENKDTILLGTEGYAAPEQYGFSSSIIQTDIYAIGVLIKELGNYRNLNDVANICTKLDPKNRYSSYSELKLALKQAKRKHYYALVGYRSGNIFFSIIATFYYLLFGFLALTVTSSNGENEFSSKLMCASMFLAVPLFTFNYLGIQEKIGLHKCKPIIRIILILILDFFIVGCIFFTFAMLISLFN